MSHRLLGEESLQTVTKVEKQKKRNLNPSVVWLTRSWWYTFNVPESQGTWKICGDQWKKRVIKKLGQLQTHQQHLWFPIFVVYLSGFALFESREHNSLGVCSPAPFCVKCCLEGGLCFSMSEFFLKKVMQRGNEGVRKKTKDNKEQRRSKRKGKWTREEDDRSGREA